MLGNDRGCRIVCRTDTLNQQVKPQSIITLQYSVTAPQKIPIKGTAFFFFDPRKTCNENYYPVSYSILYRPGHRW